jgi:hypothetical protein
VAAVDLLAAAPAISATTLARLLRIAVKNAMRILDDLVAADIAIEITHRSKRRLFGLKHLAPLRDVVRPPYRPDQGTGRGRQPRETEAEIAVPLVPPPPLTPIERRVFDYTALEETLAQLEAVVRSSRSALRTVVEGPQEMPAETAPGRAEPPTPC